MDGQLPEHYRPYNIDWAKLGYLDWPKRSRPDLQFPINPILKKFHLGRRMFYGLDEAYTLIEPAIRLASAYLASPQSMLFIYSMVYETHQMTDQINASTGKPHSHFRITAERDPKVVLRKIHRVFQQTALFNTWGPKPDWDGPRVAGCTLGYDEIDRDGNVSGGGDLHDSNKRGHSTKIMISKDFLRQMWQLKLDGKTHSLRMLALQFELAVTLSHEAVHAIRYASNWQARRHGEWCRERGVENDHWMEYEPFFEGQVVAECGMAWETYVLGARVNARTPNYSDPEQHNLAKIPDMIDWPNPLEVATESAPDGRDCLLPRRGEALTWTKDQEFEIDHCIISMYYISSLFQQSFWTNFFHSISIHPSDTNFNNNLGPSLHIPRTIALRDTWWCMSSIPLQHYTSNLRTWNDVSKLKDRLLNSNKRVGVRINVSVEDLAT